MVDEPQPAQAPDPPQPPKVSIRRLRARVIVLFALISAYCLVPIAALAICLYIMAFDSANWYVEDVSILEPLRMIAANPLSPPAILQQIAVPIAAGLSGANFIAVVKSRLLGPVLGLCLISLLSGLLVSLLFQWRSGFPATEITLIQTYFNGTATTIGVYMLFLLGLRGTVDGETS